MPSRYVLLANSRGSSRKRGSRDVCISYSRTTDGQEANKVTKFAFGNKVLYVYCHYENGWWLVLISGFQNFEISLL
jgi:hypothetical protein